MKLSKHDPFFKFFKILQSAFLDYFEGISEGANAFPGKGHVKPSDAEVVNLRKELAIVREERDILKKALGIFSSQRK